MDKINANNQGIKPDISAVKAGDATITVNANLPVESLRIEVYKGDKFIGKKLFTQGRIVIGKSLEADLVLSDETVADQHACITLIDKQVIILDQTQKGSLRVNGALCGISIINIYEQVGIGPYTLKITHLKEGIDNKASDSAPDNESLKEANAQSDNEGAAFSSATGIFIAEQAKKGIEQSKKNEPPEVDLFSLFEGGQVDDNRLFDLVFEGDIKAGLDVQDVKSGLAKILKVEESRIEPLFKGNRVVLKSNLEIETAKKYKNVVEKSGALCRLYVSSSSIIHEHAQVKAQEKKAEAKKEHAPVKKTSENTGYEKRVNPGNCRPV
jgi:hypothetical protein